MRPRDHGREHRQALWRVPYGDAGDAAGPVLAGAGLMTAVDDLLRSFRALKDGYRTDATYNGETVRSTMDSVIWHFEQALPKIIEEAKA